MRKQKKPVRREKPQPPQKQSILDTLITFISNLSEPAQILLVIGLLLIIAWIISNPTLLRDIIRALQFWFIIKNK